MYYAVTLATLVTMGLALARAVIGPTVYDRVLAVNMFGTKTVLLVSVIAFLFGRPDFLDLALAYALINFIGVLAVLLLSLPVPAAAMPLYAPRTAAVAGPFDLPENLPAFDVLSREGVMVMSESRAVHQDIRELHIGLLNMMPDAALAATERQFFRLVGESNQIAQFYVHPFTLAGLQRSAEAQAHIERYYQSFDAVRKDGLDALIITGANVSHPDLSQEPFWEPLREVFD